MRSKTKKLIWAAPLVAVFAVIGALAIFAAQPADPAEAHGLPGVAGNLAAAADGTMAIDLSWDAPTTGGAPTSYRIDRSADGNVWESLTTIAATASPSHKDTGLKANTSYYYRVFAVNSAGVGPVSRDVLQYTDSVSGPGRVTGLVATANGQNEVNLRWTAPADNGGAAITRYQIHFAGPGKTFIKQSETDLTTVTDATGHAVDPGINETADDDDGAANRTTYTVKNLKADTRYRFVVYAVNAKTTNSASKSALPSNTASATTDKLQKPAPPQRVTAVQTAANNEHAGSTIKLYWFAPDGERPGGNEISNYKVEVSLNGRDFKAATDADDQGLVTPTWSDAAGDEEPTYTHDATYTHTDGTYGIEEGGTAIKTVRFKVYTMTDDNGTADGNTNEMTSASGTVSNTVTLVTDPDGAGGITTQNQLARLIPPAPTISDKADTEDGFEYDLFGVVTGKWTAPAIADTNNPNRPKSIGGYRIDVSDDGMSWRPVVDHTRKTTAEYEYTEAKPKHRYYRVFAWQGQYLGQAQGDPAKSVYNAGTEKPAHVTGLTVTEVSPSQIDVSWDKLTNTGSAPFKEYEIQGVKKTGNTTFAAWLTSPADDSTDDKENRLFATSKTESYSHKMLSAGETWKYRVIPVNKSTTAANSRPAAAEALEDQATTPQASVPMAPEGLVAEDAKDSNLTGTSNRGVLLLWNAPSPPDGATITSYTIQRSINNGAWVSLASKRTMLHTDYTDTLELKAGETRMYRVAAYNGNTMGAWATVAYPVAAHTHVMAVTPNPLTAQTVHVGATATVDASAGFTVTGLTYSSVSSNTAVATVNATGNPVTVTGVGAGSATITVTATDPGMTKATQTFTVTVTPVDTSLGAPSGVDTCVAGDPGCPDLTAGQVRVTWTNGKNAVAHVAGLLQGTTLVHVATAQTDGTATFSNVMPGTYLVGVAAFDSDFNLMIGVADASLIVP